MAHPAIDARLRAIASSLQRIVRNLRALGYAFDRPDEVLPGPHPNVVFAIQRIEREVGLLPAALKLFWTRIGSVDLRGGCADWVGCTLPDPLVVHPASVAVAELDEFVADSAERLRCNFPYVVPVAPDALHKAGVSGRMWYNIAVPAVADDPPLNDEPHDATFLGYLDIALRWGGFPGLETCPHHNWPLARILAE